MVPKQYQAEKDCYLSSKHLLKFKVKAATFVFIRKQSTLHTHYMAIRILSKPTRKNKMRMRLTIVDRWRKRGGHSELFAHLFLLAVVYYYSMMVYTSPIPFHNCPPLVLRTLSNLCNCGCHFTGTDVSCVNRKKWTQN